MHPGSKGVGLLIGVSPESKGMGGHCDGMDTAEVMSCCKAMCKAAKADDYEAFKDAFTMCVEMCVEHCLAAKKEESEEDESESE